MSTIEVYVVIDRADVHAGTLFFHRRRGTESATFSYASQYLARPDAYSLDPALPLTSGALQTPVGQALFGAFTDSSPDRWGRTLLIRREARLARVEGRTARALGEADHLLGVRDDLRHGALRFASAAGTFLAEVDAGVPALTDLPALLDLAARAERDTADLPDLQRLIRVGSSLGGARPKAHVRTEDGKIAIAKFPSADHDTWNVMAWEKVALDLAAAGGIDVPPSRLLNLAGRHVLVVDRFDRTTTGGRIGYVSAMTMLEARDGDQRTYVEIAEVIENHSRRATQELHELWRRVVFSVLISNTDDHLRNHGFLHVRNDSWRLSPAFDLNPNPTPGPRFSSTAISDADDQATLDHARSVADYFRLHPDGAEAVIRKVAGAVSNWRTVAARHGITESEISTMTPAFSALDAIDAAG